MVHAGDHQRGVQQAEDHAAEHWRQVKQHDHAFGDQDAQVTGHRADDRQRQHAGNDDGGDGHDQQLNGIGHPCAQPFLDHAHHVCSQQDRQDLPLVADLLDLEHPQNVEVRQALTVQPGHGLAVVPGVEQVGVYQHQAEHDAEDFTAAKALGRRPAHQRGQEHERGVGHQVDQAPHPVQRRVGIEQGFVGNEHAFGAEQVVHPHQQAGNDQRGQNRHEHIREHPHQTLHGVGLVGALLLDVGNGRRGEAGLLAQGGVDLLDVAGADDHLVQATGKEGTFDQVNLIEGCAIDQAGVFQREAQAGDAVRGLLQVVDATQALQQLTGNLRIIVAHALSSA